MRLWSTGKPRGINETVIGKVARAPIADVRSRGDYIVVGTTTELGSFASDWNGYAAVLSSDVLLSTSPLPPRVVSDLPNLEYLGERDVVAVAPDGTVRVWYRYKSNSNTLLLTEQCNSYCLMCSQPPKERDDSYRVPLLLRLFELIDPGADFLTLSGGEPTLLGDSFFEIITKAKAALPTTALHVLTNGRWFEDADLARRLAAIDHHDLVLGIPLYSDIDWRHDYVVQRVGAYDETISGLYNLGENGVRVEVRVVLHQQTFERLPDLARFISRNLPFVEHVALMGLEMFGFTPGNLPVLWVDPLDYATQLTEAVRTLALHGTNVSIYNHQLCVLPKALWPFARQSISDWKNVYLPQCDGCVARQYCGGFFQSGTKRYSRGIRAFESIDERTKSLMQVFAGEFGGTTPDVAIV